MSANPVHAGAASWRGHAVLVRGDSGTGKSTLMCELLARGWMLVGDDYVLVEKHHHQLTVKPAPTLAGLIEVRTVGIVRTSFRQSARLVLVADLVSQEPERYPELQETTYESIYVPFIRLQALQPDLCSKLETAFCQALCRGLAIDQQTG